MINAASYERVSSEEQAREGYSLEVQNQKNVAYIHAQEGWKFAESYIDPGKSGKNLKRPEMKRLLTDIEKNRIQALVIHKLDRLTRNIGDLHYLLHLFDTKDVKLVSISENLDTSTAMGRMFVYMLGIFAQWYRENLSEEVLKGQTARAAKGLRNSPMRPYGYHVGENQIMTIIEDEEVVVQKIYELFLEGFNFGGIAAHLNKNGIPATFGGKWNPNVVGRVLDNPTYLGTSHWKRRIDSEEKRTLVPNAHPAIITLETYEAAQDILQQRREHFLSQSMGEFCFSTVVKCGLCGKSYAGRTRRESKNVKKDYRCSGSSRDKCKGGHITEKKLTELFLDFISNINLQIDEPQKVISGRDTQKEKKRLEKQLSDSVNARRNYARAYGAGKLEFELYIELAGEEEKKSEAWQTELDEINLLSPQSKKTMKDILNQIENLKENWYSWDEMKRKMAVSRIFKFIVIKRTDEWRIVGFKKND